MLSTIKTMLLAEYSVSQWVLVFFMYSFAGWCWEVMLSLVRRRQFVNRGFLTGPILPIYGFGALSVLLTCVPVKDCVIAVALVGTLAASVLEYVTGFAMERLFHVRYWDYSSHRLNLNGYICLMSAATWAVFSAVIVCVVHPFFQPYVSRISSVPAATLAVTLSVFAVLDTVFAVRRALDLRALLESMERYAKELEALYGGLGSIGDRVGDMIRAFAEQVDERREGLSAGLEHITAARDRVAGLLAQKRVNMEEGLRERLAGFESILSDVADFLPDTAALRAEVQAAKARYDRQSEALRQARARRLKRAGKVLRRNPTASSRWYGGEIEALRQAKEGEDTLYEPPKGESAENESK